MNKMAFFALIFGLSVMFTSYIIVTNLFLEAYVNESKSVLITINEYHEAKIELIMFMLSFPCALWVIVQAVTGKIYVD